MHTNEKFLQALLEAAKWESQMTEEEASQLTHHAARAAVVRRIFEKHKMPAADTSSPQSKEPVDFRLIKTVKDALDQAKRYDTKISLPDVSAMEEEMGDYILAHAELAYVIQEVNRNKDGTIWKPDYAQGVHYEPYHGIEVKGKGGKLVPSGVGFSVSFFDCWRSNSCVGARLSFPDTERGNHVLEHFNELYLRTKLIK